MNIMEMIERAISVRRLGKTQRARYRVFVEGVTTEPVLLTGSQLGHVLGLILGEDVAVPFKQVADGETGEFSGRPWLTPGQDDALRVLITAYGSAQKQSGQAFRKGEGDYIHQQGPAPQQLEHDGVGHVVVSVGQAIGPCAFSSLAATRQWLGTDMAKRFMRAYRKARAWLLATPAANVAEAEASFFPEIDRAVLTATIGTYQKLGCWTPHVEITRPAFEVALDVFQHAGLITKRHRYEDVVITV